MELDKNLFSTILVLVVVIGGSLLVTMVGGFAIMRFTERQAQPDLCNQIASLENKDACFHQVAARTGEVKYCNLIENKQTKDLCLTDLAQGNTWVSGGFD
jgi:hypothetical protein